MATLYFKVSADVDKVIRMRQEVEKLKAALVGMDAGKQGKDVATLMARIGELETALAGTTRAAAQAAAALKEGGGALKGFAKLTEEPWGVERVVAFARAVASTRAEMERLKAAMAAGPYGWAATAVTALGYAVYKWATYENEATKAQRRMNAAVSDGAVAAAGETRVLDGLLGKLASCKEESEEFRRLREEIFGRYGQYLSGLNRETAGIDELRQAYDGLTKSIRDSYAARAAQKFMEGETAANDADLTKKITKLDKILRERGTTPEQWGSIRDSLLAGNDLNASDTEHLDKVQNKGTILAHARLDSLAKEIQALVKRQQELPAIAARRFGIDLSQLTAPAGTPPSAPPPFTPPSPPENGESPKDYRAAAQAAAQERAELLRNAEYAVAQAQIDAMQEGTAKVIAQNELNFKKETDDIAQRRQEYLETLQKDTPSATTLPDEAENLFARQEEQAQTKRDAANKKALEADLRDKQAQLEALLAKYRNYEARRTAIVKAGEDDVKKLQAGRTAENAAAVDAAVAEAQKATQEAVSAIDMEELKKGLNWSVVFDDLGKLTKQSLDALETQLRDFAAKAGKTLSETDLKTLTDALKKIEDFRIHGNPFAALKKYAQEYAAAVKEGNEEGKKAAATKLTKATNEVGKMGQQLGGAVKAIADMFGHVGVELPKEANIILEHYGEVFNTLAEIDFNNPVSVIVGGVKLAANLVSTVGDLFGAQVRDYTALIAQYQRMADVFGGLLDKEHEVLQEAKGADNVSASYQKATALLKAQTAADRQAMSYWGGNRKAYDRSFVYNYEKGRKGVNDKNLLGGVGWDEMLNKDADWWRKQQENADAWVRLTPEVREYGESVIAAAEEMDALGESMREATTGVSFSSLADEIMDLATAAETTAETVGESFEDDIRAGIKRALSAKYENDIKAYDQHLADAWANDGKIDEREAAALKTEKKAIVDKIDRDYEAATAAAGISSNNLSSQEGTRGAWAAMSQDTGNELNGRFTALQMAGEEIRTQAVAQSFTLAGLSEKVGLTQLTSGEIRDIASETRTILLNSYIELQQISENTGKVVKPIQGMADNMERLVTHMEGL
jgi:hypothetical protein